MILQTLEQQSARSKGHHAPVPTLTLETPEGITLRTEIAGLGSRVAAAVLDLVLLISGLIALGLILYLANLAADEVGLDAVTEFSEFLGGLLLGGVLILFPVYFSAVHVLMDGRSPGKRMLGLRVVASSGYSASTGQHTLRGLLWLVDALVMVPVPLGFILIGAAPRSRRLGDLAADTLVVHDTALLKTEEPWPRETWTAREKKHLALTAGMAARLEEEDQSLLRDAVLRRRMPKKLREKLYRDIVEHYAARLGFSPSEMTRTSLKELYLFAREFRRGGE